MAKVIAGIEKPELVIGIAGPIGIDIDALNDVLEEQLKAVGYSTKPIRITKEIEDIASTVKVPKTKNYHTEIRYKMRHASAICRKYKDQSYLMRIAIDAIQREREAFYKGNEPKRRTAKKTSVRPVPQGIAYVIRQIKRPKEVELMREVYGKQFVLISAYGAERSRKAIIEEKLRRSMSLGTRPATISSRAEDLIQLDADEVDDEFGQHMRDAFHLADVFVDGIDKRLMKEKVGRFVEAFFGLNEIAPSKNEYGMYAAKGASLRSSDLSRQVGAAVFTTGGELLTQGCNEVPRAFGGTYWDGEQPDYRDIKLGSDPNEIIKREVLRDLLERLSDAKLLTAAAEDDPINLVDRLT